MDANIPYGYCQCGCGEKAPIAKRDYHYLGIRKGQPRRYVASHNARLKSRRDPDADLLANRRAWEAGTDIPYGFCWCGCGQKTPLNRTSNVTYGRVAGSPARYINGHHCHKSLAHYKVEDRGHETPCWIWQRAINAEGYGTFYEGGSFYRAHRYHYERVVGPIPDGMVLHHECSNRPCVNPDHLTPMTQNEHSRAHR